MSPVLNLRINSWITSNFLNYLEHNFIEIVTEKEKFCNEATPNVMFTKFSKAIEKKILGTKPNLKEKKKW